MNTTRTPLFKSKKYNYAFVLSVVALVLWSKNAETEYIQGLLQGIVTGAMCIVVALRLYMYPEERTPLQIMSYIGLLVIIFLLPWFSLDLLK